MFIGIDLGTTHSCLAFTKGTDDAVASLPIPQQVSASETHAEDLLPSFLYLPTAQESEERFIVGRYAQQRGAETLGRMVASAKSWLSYAGVDRTSALLPLNAPDGVARLSPVAASREYLSKLKDAWEESHPDEPFTAQRVVVTVPASFDEVARELTLSAAREAGYPEVVLLEEPQAAFYSWIEKHPDWRERVAAGDLILVVDIGGGTTDFTLIAVRDQGGSLGLERIAVGEHILLGGDNMDLALAQHVAAQLTAKGTKLDTLQFQALWQHCRTAKEHLLDPAYKKSEYPVTILGKGSGLVGGTIKASLSRADVERLIVDGFLPHVAGDASPERARRAALAELGLPYASDAAITRHLARFLRLSGDAVPTHVLFNGGVLRAPSIRERLLAVLNSWTAAPVVELPGEDLMHGVARGAAYFAHAREGKGVRIRGGVARSYYVGIETSLPAVPGMPAPLKALTVVPAGLEEGSELKFPDRQFGLLVGEPAEFRFFSSSIRKHDAAGSMLDEVTDLEEMPPMEVTLTGDAAATTMVPVTLETAVTDTGMLELWCVAKDGRRWKLEFNVREKVQA